LLIYIPLILLCDWHDLRQAVLFCCYDYRLLEPYPQLVRSVKVLSSYSQTSAACVVINQIREITNVNIGQVIQAPDNESSWTCSSATERSGPMRLEISRWKAWLLTQTYLCFGEHSKHCKYFSSTAKSIVDRTSTEK